MSREAVPRKSKGMSPKSGTNRHGESIRFMGESIRSMDAVLGPHFSISRECSGFWTESPGCSRNCSGQSTLEPFRTTPFNSIAATHSIEISYRLAIATEFNKQRKLVRDQGSEIPLSPTKLLKNKWLIWGMIAS